MMAHYAVSGKRPYFWWLLESEKLGITFHFPRDWDRQEAILYEHDWLEPDEREMLLKHWRCEFDHTQRPGFTLQRGTTLLQGFAARRAYLQVCGVPKSLVLKWEAAPPDDAA